MRREGGKGGEREVRREVRKRRKEGRKERLTIVLEEQAAAVPFHTACSPSEQVGHPVKWWSCGSNEEE